MLMFNGVGLNMRALWQLDPKRASLPNRSMHAHSPAMGFAQTLDGGEPKADSRLRLTRATHIRLEDSLQSILGKTRTGISHFHTNP